MSDDDDDDDYSMVWEEEASSAVETLLKDSEYDEIRGTIPLPPRDSDKHFGQKGSGLESLKTFEVGSNRLRAGFPQESPFPDFKR
jgi:hypothetical protein